MTIARERKEITRAALALPRESCWAMAVEPPLSPCNGVCRIDPPTGLCAGCSRTLAEIAAWPAMAHDQQRALLVRLAGRR